MSKTARQEYKIGQRVFMPRYGIARISSVETENIAGQDIEMFRLTFDNKDDIFSAQANLNTIKKIPVFKADKSFFGLPSPNKFSKIIAVATSDSQTMTGLWKHQQVKLEDALKSGDLMMIAWVFRKTKEGMDSTEASYSKRILYDEALKTLCAVYAEVFHVEHAEAMNIFVPQSTEPAGEAINQIPEAEIAPALSVPLPEDRKEPEKEMSLGAKWDMPIVSALRISSIFSQKTRDQILEKLPCKSLSELFNLTKGDWPLYAPTTAGISREDARIIQMDTQELVTHLSRNIA